MKTQSARVPREASARSAQIAVARVVGRYALFEEIAAGGMATVHIGRLRGAAGFARTVAIKQHHHERLEKLRQISRDLGPATVQAYSQRLFRPRSWGAMAESETYAHLEHLRLAGDAERRIERDGTFLYVAG